MEDELPRWLGHIKKQDPGACSELQFLLDVALVKRD